MTKLITILMLVWAVGAQAQTVSGDRFRFNTGPCYMTSGSGSPEGTVTAPICYYYLRTDTGDIYTKQSGSGNTGWTLVPRLSGTNTWTGTQTFGSTSTTGTATIGTASVTGNATVGGTLGVTGNTTVGGTLGVTGTTTLNALSAGGSIVPTVSDTFNLGSPFRLWNRGYISEMNATLFSKNTQTLYGGWLAVTKNAGVLAASVAAADTSVDFGQAMTLNSFILIRAADNNTGAITAEFMQVGSLVSGTRYNVTRNLSGLGAKDWATGTPYAVRGVTGDGWLELNAFDTPRLSVFTQGSTYNNSTENIRIGHLAGMPNSSSGIGTYMGDATNYFRWDGSTLTVQGASATLNNSGLTLGTTTIYNGGGALKYSRAAASGYGTGTGDAFGVWGQSVNAGFQTDTLNIENTMVTPNNGGGFATNIGDAIVNVSAKGWNTLGSGSAQPEARITLRSGQSGVAAARITLTADTVTATGTLTERSRSAPMGEWTTYTPTWTATGGTAPSVGNGTLFGRYMQIGKTVFVDISLSAGSTTTFGAGFEWAFSLPITGESFSLFPSVGSAHGIDSGTAHHTGVVVMVSTTTVKVLTEGGTSTWTSVSPFPWASGDVMRFSFHYSIP